MIEEDLVVTFGTSNLYEILGIDKGVTSGAIKKAYYKRALELHPDRQSNDKEDFTVKFQLLHQIYTLLSDKDRRSEYDKFGTLTPEENLSEKSADEWSAYWRELFRKVTVDDIVSFEREYKGSLEERNDIKEFYTKFKGDMDMIMDNIMLVKFDEEDRIRMIIDDLISRKEVKSYQIYSKENPKKRKKREQKGKKEAKEAEQHKNDLGEDDLFKAITLRQEERNKNMDSFFSQLEAKYAQPPKRRKKK